MEATDRDIINSLKTPNGFISFVIDNNLPAVNKRLMEGGYTTYPVSREEAFQIIAGLFNDGKTTEGLRCVNVPFNVEAKNGTEYYAEHLLIASQELKTKNRVPLRN